MTFFYIFTSLGKIVGVMPRLLASLSALLPIQRR
jgi:hypothetical protein